MGCSVVLSLAEIPEEERVHVDDVTISSFPDSTSSTICGSIDEELVTSLKDCLELSGELREPFSLLKVFTDEQRLESS